MVLYVAVWDALTLTRSPRWLRRLAVIAATFPPFFAVLFTRQGLGSREGRQLIRGKFRRVCLSFFPALSRRLQQSHGLSGGCRSCGASCKLLFQCPHWDEASSLCSVYEDRPNICRLFPITPADVSDRNLVQGIDGPCGFRFTAKNGQN